MATTTTAPYNVNANHDSHLPSIRSFFNYHFTYLFISNMYSDDTMTGPPLAGFLPWKVFLSSILCISSYKWNTTLL